VTYRITSITGMDFFTATHQVKRSDGKIVFRGSKAECEHFIAEVVNALVQAGA